MRFPSAVLAALWIGLSGAAASAGEVTIQFDFTGSTLSILGGVITIPPGGTITAASGNATFLATGPTQISAGPARLEALDVDAACTGVGCPFIGTFPINIAGNFTVSNLNAVVGNLATLSAATLMATLPISLSGFSGVLNLVGSEVSRSFSPVPEPGTFGALSLGLVALALVARFTRRPH